MLERRREGAVELLLIDRPAVRNALERGLADVCVAAGAAEAEALAQAARLAELPPPAVASTKRFFAGLAGAAELDRLAAEAYRAAAPEAPRGRSGT